MGFLFILNRRIYALFLFCSNAKPDEMNRALLVISLLFSISSYSQVFEGEYDFRATIDMWTKSGKVDTLHNTDIYFKVSGEYFMEFKNGVLISKRKLKSDDGYGIIELMDNTIVSFSYSNSERIAGTTTFPNSSIIFTKRIKNKDGTIGGTILRWYRGTYSDL